MDKLFEQAPRIIEAAARSPLGVLALMVMAVAATGIVLFRDAAEWVRLIVFGLLFAGAAGFGSAVLRQRTSRTVGAPAERAAHRLRLRDEPGVVSSSAVTAALVRHGLYDARRNPAGPGVAHHYQQQLVGEVVTVLERTTALQWQAGGMPPVTFTEAGSVAARANAGSFAGYSDWRLPTVEEAAALLQPDVAADLHIAPLFERGTYFIWTADRMDADNGWVVYFREGTVSCERVAFNASVRLVRSC